MHLTTSFEQTRFGCNIKHTRNVVWINFKQNGFIIDIVVMRSYVSIFECNLIKCCVYIVYTLPMPQFIIYFSEEVQIIKKKNFKGPTWKILSQLVLAKTISTFLSILILWCVVSLCYYYVRLFWLRAGTVMERKHQFVKKESLKCNIYWRLGISMRWRLNRKYFTSISISVNCCGFCGNPSILENINFGR
jgi:hypothetical protein